MPFWTRFKPETARVGAQLRRKYASFRHLLTTNNELLKEITELEGALVADRQMLVPEMQSMATDIKKHVEMMVDDLNVLADGRYAELRGKVDTIAAGVGEEYRQVHGRLPTRLCIPLEGIGRELADAVGKKTSNLGEVRNRVGLPVPQGFAVTSSAYRLFVDGSGIQERLDKLWNQLDLEDRIGLSRISTEMMQLVREARIPPDVEKEIALAARNLDRKTHGKARVSIRSSAIGEDARSTFAGLYATFLNIPIDQILLRYKEMVASKFSSRALFYMRTHGFRESEIAMGVGCFLMVDAIAAGVAYSVDPTDAARNKMLVSAVWGLGKPVVDGTVTPDSYVVSRRPGKGILEIRTAKKETRLVPAREGLMEESLPLEMRAQPCLTQEQIMRLAQYLRALETHYRCPQDVEWALDRSGRLYILQTRALRIEDRNLKLQRPDATTMEQKPILEGGRTAAPGAGCGPVVRAESDYDLSVFPAGGVLVARQMSPRFVEVMTRAAAILTDVGSPTGHMASLSREYHVPTIVDLRGATDLPEGLTVTVDASHLRVFQGPVEEIIVGGLRNFHPRLDLPSFALLERIVERIARLNLTDRSKSAFRAKNCQTYHDVARFCHEMAIWEMFNLNDYRNLGEKCQAFRLESEIPLGIYIIDLGGGLDREIQGRIVRPNQILSAPMRALWTGMSTPGVRWGGAKPIDLKGFLSVLANTMYDSAKGERELGDNSYAIVSSTYLNFGSRLGYHFTTLDSVCSESLNDNYILFRFKGGAADIERRVRRTRFVGEILAHYRFEINQSDDLLHAWVKKLPGDSIKELLMMIGRLIGCARQLDVVMNREATVERCEEAFLHGAYGFFDFRGENRITNE
jgi:pyruvate,water dikinase